MVNTLEWAFQPLSVAAFIFGFGVLRCPADTPRIRLSILYMLTMWSVYVYVFYYMMSFFSSRIFHGILEIFIVTINIFVMIMSIINSLQKYQKFRMCIRKLSFVDNTLELIGTPKEYCKIRNSAKWIFIKWSIMVCMAWFIDSLWFIETYNDDIRAIFIPIIKDYLQHINNLMDIIYMFLLRHLHSELCRITCKIHGFYELHMTFQMMSYFVILIAIMNFQYHAMLCVRKMYFGDSIQIKLLLCSHVWFVICLTRCLSVNYVCESVSTKAQKTKDMIHKLTNHICFTEARGEIFQFILQISLRPLKFSGLGLFYFGNKFILEFFVSSAAAVVFMLQSDTTIIPRIIFSNRNITC